MDTKINTNGKQNTETSISIIELTDSHLEQVIGGSATGGGGAGKVHFLAPSAIAAKGLIIVV